MNRYMLSVVGAALVAAALTIGLALWLAPALLGGTGTEGAWPVMLIVLLVTAAALVVRKVWR
jgi:hypothetical protein